MAITLWLTIKLFAVSLGFSGISVLGVALIEGSFDPTVRAAGHTVYTIGVIGAWIFGLMAAVAFAVCLLRGFGVQI